MATHGAGRYRSAEAGGRAAPKPAANGNAVVLNDLKPGWTPLHPVKKLPCGLNNQIGLVGRKWRRPHTLYCNREPVARLDKANLIREDQSEA